MKINISCALLIFKFNCVLAYLLASIKFETKIRNRLRKYRNVFKKYNFHTSIKPLQR